MNTIQPIFTPHTTVDRCPECGKTEDKVRVCNHCGYKYPEEDDSVGFKVWALLIFAYILGTWVLGTLTDWLRWEDTPIETIAKQWEWIINRRIW